jgi:hypothetical protein
LAAAAAEYQRTRTVKFSSLTLMKTDEMSRVISQAKTYYTALLFYFYFLFFQNNNLPDIHFADFQRRRGT